MFFELFQACKKLSIKNNFHITCETASKLNQSKIFCFFWMWAILNFKQTWLKINSLTFCKTYFEFETAFKTNLFKEWGCWPWPQAQRAWPPLKKFGLKAVSNSKYVLQKVKEFILSQVWFKFKMAHIQKKQKSLLWFNITGKAISQVVWKLKKRFPNPAFRVGMNVSFNKNGLVRCMTMLLLPL